MIHLLYKSQTPNKQNKMGKMRHHLTCKWDFSTHTVQQNNSVAVTVILQPLHVSHSDHMLPSLGSALNRKVVCLGFKRFSLLPALLPGKNVECLCVFLFVWKFLETHGLWQIVKMPAYFTTCEVQGAIIRFPLTKLWVTHLWYSQSCLYGQ